MPYPYLSPLHPDAKLLLAYNGMALLWIIWAKGF